MRRVAVALALLLAAILPAHSDFGGGNNLLGFWASCKEPFGLSFITSNLTATNNTTQTWTSISIGAEPACLGKRIIAVAVDAIATVDQSVSTLTIGGITATLAIDQTEVRGSISTNEEIWYAVVPTGTTANVVVTWNTSMNNHGIAVYRIVGYKDATPFSTGSGTGGSTVSATLTFPSDGAVMAGLSYSETGALRSVTSWTNLATMDISATVEGFGIHSAAHGTGSGSITVSPVYSGNGAGNLAALAAASWH